MIDIIHKDKHIIVANKPAPLDVIPGGWDKNAPNLKELLEKRFGGKKLWTVHRLDKGTTGVIVFARTAEAHRHLNDQFERHEVEKIYHAVVEGEPEWDQYTAQHSLHANVGRKHRTVVDKHRGKPSQTDLRVTKRFFDYALLEARPKTGRTHQVRVHCAAMDHPLVGDILYGAEANPNFERPALHAHFLSFIHPISGQKVSFSAPHPDDFAELIDLLEVS